MSKTLARALFRVGMPLEWVSMLVAGLFARIFMKIHNDNVKLLMYLEGHDEGQEDI